MKSTAGEFALRYGMVMLFIPIVFAIIIYSSTGSLYGNQYDDSYITYRYAVNLAEHGQLAFNLGERADAASSFLFTVVLAAFWRLGLHNMEFVSYLLNMAALGLIAVFVSLSAFWLSGNRGAAIALGMIAAFHGFVSGWAALGMDTVPYVALLVMWAYWTFARRNDTASMILTGLIVLARFEGLMVVPIWWFATGRNGKRALIVLALCGIYYIFRFAYYGTIFSHALLAKRLLTYYQPNPENILNIWRHFAFAAPFLALAGVLMQRRLIWLGIYIAASAAACLLGPHSDWARYSVHLFPLMLIAGAPVMKRRYVAIAVCTVLLWQGYGSVVWMRGQAARLAPAQEIRGQVGDWLQANAQGQWVLSGDLGQIAYRAMDCKFIDLFGLTSPDILKAYRSGKNAGEVIEAKHPRYIADTFNMIDNKPVFTHTNPSFVRDGATGQILGENEFALKAGSRYSRDIVIAAAEIK